MAIGRYLMDRKDEVLALSSGKSMLSWVDAHQEEALAIAVGMQSISEQLGNEGR
jgi:hypothetical protein